MPEGDTLWRIAARLSPALVGRRVTALRAHAPALAAAARRFRVAGSTISAVEARGKHLLIRFSTGVALHTHLGMTGSWHLYRTGSRWRQPAHLARVVVEAGDILAVCFVPRVAELVAAADEARHPSLAALGPDVVAPDLDVAAAVARVRARGEIIGPALLGQAALSGVGNIYKSEGLFLCGVDPFAPVSSLGEETLRRVVQTVHDLMRRAVVAPRGRTAAGGAGARWVYGRSGRPCRRCATLVRRARQGRPSRTTYWCPRCQPPV